MGQRGEIVPLHRLPFFFFHMCLGSCCSSSPGASDGPIHAHIGCLVSINHSPFFSGTAKRSRGEKRARGYVSVRGFGAHPPVSRRAVHHSMESWMARPLLLGPTARVVKSGGTAKLLAGLAEQMQNSFRAVRPSLNCAELPPSGGKGIVRSSAPVGRSRASKQKGCATNVAFAPRLLWIVYYSLIPLAAVSN